MSKFKSNCPCTDIVRCCKCGKQICREIHEANIHYCTPEKKGEHICDTCTREALNV